MAATAPDVVWIGVGGFLTVEELIITVQVGSEPRRALCSNAAYFLWAPLRKSRHLSQCIRFGLPSILRMHDILSWSHEDSREGGGAPLANACELGDFGAARWLTETFDFTPLDVRGVNNRALGKACEHGHVELAEWLAYEYELGPRDARIANNYILRKAQENGHAVILAWLRARFHIEEDELLNYDSYVKNAELDWLSRRYPVVVIANDFSFFRPDPDATRLIYCLFQPVWR